MGGNDQYTKILLHFDGADGSTTITDYCAGATPHTWTNHTGSISTSASKFGGSSYNCGAATGWVDTPDSADFTLGSSDFTIDCWFNRQGGDGTNRYMCGTFNGTQSTRSAELLLAVGNTCVFTVTNGSTQTNVAGTTSITSTGWHHIAGVRTGNTLKLFVDGVQEGGDVSFSTSVNDSSLAYNVGRLPSGSYNFYGYLDEFRMSVGIARWTSNFPLSNSCYG